MKNGAIIGLMIFLGFVLSSVGVIAPNVVNTSSTCYDSDGGLNAFVAGYAAITCTANNTVNNGTGYGCNAVAYTDQCNDDVHLQEYYCSEGQVASMEKTCTAGCTDGACESETNAWCNDTDGGKDFYAIGRCTDSSGRNFPDGNIYDKEGWIRESYCSNNLCSLYDYLCPYGKSQGACLKKNDTTQDCTIGYRCYHGNVEWYNPCPPENGGVKEYCKNGCLNAKCIESPIINEPETYCKDYDGGWEYYQKSYAESSASGKTEDYCLADGIRVAETGCSVWQGVAVYSYFACPNGCSDGACIKSGTVVNDVTCSDSDQGSDYNKQGTAVGKFKNEVGFIKAADFCSDNQLKEYSCGDDGYVHYETHSCPEGCGGGMCLQGEATGVTATASLTSTNEDRASTQSVFAKGPGFNGKDKSDFGITVSLSFTETKTIKKMVLNHNTYGQAWSTSSEKGFGLDLYPLVVFNDGTQVNKKYDVSIGTFSPGDYELTIYGQAESSSFSGGNLLIVFSDGTFTKVGVSGQGTIQPATIIITPQMPIQSNETPVQQKNGYLAASWECYDGTIGNSEKEQPGNQCMPPAYWLSRAKKECNDKCSDETGKCGVNSFGLSKDCTVGQDVEIPEVVTNMSDLFQCINSCSLDNKCYDFGYRKSGKYCSDSGVFVDWKDGESACDNNWECSSNICVSSQCVSEGLMTKILKWFKGMFSGKE